MIYIERPHWGEKRVWVTCSIQREAWELWQHYCNINGEHPSRRFQQVLQLALVRDLPTLQAFMQGDGRPSERSHRPPAATGVKS
jgi:hypothetical protein